MDRTFDQGGFTEKRQYARIGVGIRARVQPLDPQRVETVRDQILTRSSVWAPSQESTLRELASSGARGSDSLLARTVLELAAEIARLRTKVLEPAAPVVEAFLSQLSGGGGQIVCDIPLDKDDLFEIRFEDDDESVPPIHAIGRAVHRVGEDRSTGFRFEALHPQDHDLLIRLIYQIQRRALRRAHQHA